MINPVAIILLFFATITGALGITLMKKGVETVVLKGIMVKPLSVIKQSCKNGKLILGIGLFALSTIFFITSLKFGELHILYSLTGMTYVWLLIFADRYLKEQVTITKMMGTGLIIAGIILLSI